MAAASQRSLFIVCTLPLNGIILRFFFYHDYACRSRSVTVSVVSRGNVRPDSGSHHGTPSHCLSGGRAEAPSPEPCSGPLAWFE